MVDYAAANQAVIQEQIAKHLGLATILGIENHHNFAWQEEHMICDVRRLVVVHRKGATPAGLGAIGSIPGSMATLGFVLRGRRVATSLDSASHGAGRRMSRTQARKSCQVDLVEAPDVIQPRLVKLAQDGERPED
jgi:tRNA-splicing ligase RtcB